jgi:hypothetical protein
MKFDVSVNILTYVCAYEPAYYSGYIDSGISICHVERTVKKSLETNKKLKVNSIFLELTSNL